MSFFDKLKDFSATLRRLAARWRVLGALALLIGFGALYLQKRLSPASAPPEVTAGKTTPAEKAPPAESLGDNKTGAADKTEPPAGAETPVESVSGQIVDVPARPVLVLKGQAKWDDAAKTLTNSLAKVTAAATKAGIIARRQVSDCPLSRTAQRQSASCAIRRRSAARARRRPSR